MPWLATIFKGTLPVPLALTILLAGMAIAFQQGMAISQRACDKGHLKEAQAIVQLLKDQQAAAEKDAATRAAREAALDAKTRAVLNSFPKQQDCTISKATVDILNGAAQ